jgi:hypothetical protein
LIIDWLRFGYSFIIVVAVVCVNVYPDVADVVGCVAAVGVAVVGVKQQTAVLRNGTISISSSNQQQRAHQHSDKWR